MPIVGEQDQTSVTERTLTGKLAPQYRLVGGRENTKLGSGIDPARVRRPQSRVQPKSGRLSSVLERRDRDSQVIGIIKPVASQPPPRRDVEEMLEHDLESDSD